jgi:hypothetical protein
MTITFEIASALIVCVLFVAVAMSRTYPRASVITGVGVILLLIVWANVLAGSDPSSGVQNMVNRLLSIRLLSAVPIAKTLSTLALLAVSWWISGFWFGDAPPSLNRPIRGRSMEDRSRRSHAASATQEPVRQYRNS